MPKIKPEWAVHAEAHAIVTSLCSMYPNHLGHVDPKTIGCVAIVNKDKKEGQEDSKIRGIRQPDSLFCTVQYVVVFYQSTWENYNPAQRAMMLFKNLIRIPENEDGPDGSLLKHDLQDFKILVQAFGVDYMDNPELPDISANKQVLG
jgi:hypothetical protein